MDSEAIGRTNIAADSLFQIQCSSGINLYFFKDRDGTWGRIGTGIFELIAGALILIPATTVFGALLAIALMSGAIFFHLTKLGITVQNDGGQLFIYAVLVFVSSSVLAIIYRSDLLTIKKILVRPA